MGNNTVLVGLVVTLAAALVFETAYLLGMRHMASRYTTASAHHVKQPLRPATTSLRLWSDWPAASDEQSVVLGGWEPSREMERIQRQMNRLFRDSFEKAVQQGEADFPESKNIFEPQDDVKQTDSAYFIQMDIPGLGKDQISINIRDNILTVSGERKYAMNEQEKGGIVKQEREFGYFSRSIPLPQDAREGDIKAKYDQGVLLVTIPRTATGRGQVDQPVTIKID